MGNQSELRMKRAKRTKHRTTVFEFLLPSVKMKSISPRATIFERELHEFLMKCYGGYTVTGGSITGYWIGADGAEECNEHRAYQVATKNASEVRRLRAFMIRLAAELGEKSVFCRNGGAVEFISTHR